MNITIHVLSSIECRSKVPSCKHIEELCMRLAGLYALLSSGAPAPTQKTLENMFAHGGHLVVALDDGGNIVGMGTVIFSHRANACTARVEDVVCEESCRGQGVGARIMDALVELAMGHEVGYVDLTSRPGRVEANRLYEKLGFSILDTNSRRLYLR